MKQDSRLRMDLMLDIETLGTDPNAIVLQVAFKSFQLFSSSAEENVSVDRHLSVFGNLLLGRLPDYDTLQWWNNPERSSALNELLEADRKSCDAKDGLVEVYDILSGLCDKYQVFIWCRGYDFDLTILDNAMKDAVIAAGREYRTPWSFWRKRCVRTLLDVLGIMGVEHVKSANNHNALDDCYQQIDEVIQVKDKIIALSAQH